MDSNDDEGTMPDDELPNDATTGDASPTDGVPGDGAPGGADASLSAPERTASERRWRSLGVTLGKQWKAVIAVVVVLTAVMAVGLTRVEFATGQDSYLNPDSQIAIDNVEFQDQFGGETIILLFTAEDGAVDGS